MIQLRQVRTACFALVLATAGATAEDPPADPFGFVHTSPPVWTADVGS